MLANIENLKNNYDYKIKSRFEFNLMICGEYHRLDNKLKGILSIIQIVITLNNNFILERNQ